jgi:p-hydroxybenzoate 3-monooxygenase
MKASAGGRTPSRPTIVAMRTQVGIVGSGPSGLLLAQILAQHGIESVIVENRSREYVQARIRAGVIEHDGVHLQWPGHRERIDFAASCGQSVWIYGQTQLTKDLIDARLAADQQILWEIGDTRIEDADTTHPAITFRDADGHPQRIDCDYVAGCDGFHGVSRETIPASVRTVAQRTYPFSWLGILADVAPSTDELIYAWHPDGFALHSMRSAEVSRLYLQVTPRDEVADWPDDRVWQATHFSWWMTSMLHTPPADEPDAAFLRQMQITQLAHVTSSPTAAAGLAENYTGAVLPY